MIREAYPRVITVPITDCRGDERWSASLDQIVGGMLAPGQTAILYGARGSFLSHYSGKFPSQELVGQGEFWSGTQERDRIRTRVAPTADFRAGVIWHAMNRYPTAYATVDVAIMRTAPDPKRMVPAGAPDGGMKPAPRRELLLARKPSDPPGKWRFIGGFSDPGSTSLEDDAIREVREETGLEVGGPQYVGSHLIEDWRYGGEGDKIKTSFFKVEYLFGAANAVAADDISEVRWFGADELTDDLVVPEHKCLLGMLRNFWSSGLGFGGGGLIAFGPPLDYEYGKQ
jgi:bifunctional NMN adenylyltransferase/nudix hydrolase